MCARALFEVVACRLVSVRACVRVCERVCVCARARVCVCVRAGGLEPGRDRCRRAPAAVHCVRRGHRAGPRGGGRRQRRAEGALPGRAHGRARQDGRRQAHRRRGGLHPQQGQGRRRAVAVATRAYVAPQERRAPVGRAKTAGLARRHCCRRDLGRREKPVRASFLQACLLSRTHTVIHNKFFIDVFVLLL